MITIARKARRHLTAILEHVELLEGATLRLDGMVASGNGGTPDVVMRAGEPGERDQAVEHRGEVLLHICPTVSAAYDGCVLDVIETTEGSRFSLAPLETECDGYEGRFL